MIETAAWARRNLESWLHLSDTSIVAHEISLPGAFMLSRVAMPAVGVRIRTLLVMVPVPVEVDMLSVLSGGIIRICKGASSSGQWRGSSQGADPAIAGPVRPHRDRTTPGL